MMFRRPANQSQSSGAEMARRTGPVLSGADACSSLNRGHGRRGESVAFLSSPFVLLLSLLLFSPASWREAAGRCEGEVSDRHPGSRLLHHQRSHLRADRFIMPDICLRSARHRFSALFLPRSLLFSCQSSWPGGGGHGVLGGHTPLVLRSTLASSLLQPSQLFPLSTVLPAAFFPSPFCLFSSLFLTGRMQIEHVTLDVTRAG